MSRSRIVLQSTAGEHFKANFREKMLNSFTSKGIYRRHSIKFCREHENVTKEIEEQTLGVRMFSFHNIDTNAITVNTMYIP
jgi:hypothetical protein